MCQAQDTNEYRRARLSRDSRFDGKFFVAVKSTGIFCRPICPAPSPKEQNVEYFALAQLAMQAGYRPCLRCRPDSAPASYAWKGVDTTVERAIRLLKQYPHLDLQSIASKLGISDRYFRALFNHKLGIGPKKFRLYDQLLFAKQLLHQSSLSVEQVAQASGFSSARRLQAHMKENAGLSPKQIRQQKQTNEKVLRLQLTYRPPYAWSQVRDFWAARAIPGMEEVKEHSYSRTFSLGETQGWFCATHQAEKHAFSVALVVTDLSKLKAVVDEIRRILDLNADPLAISPCLSQSGLAQHAQCHGIRIPGVWGQFEAGCRAILGQQISVKGAIKLVTSLVHQLGDKQEQKFFFPTPAQVMASDLSFLGMPVRRRASLRELARVCQDSPRQDDLNGWLQINGVGPWTLAYAQMRGQSQPDIWLASDLVIKKQLAHHQITPDAARPWRSYLTFQLWSMA